MYYLLYEVFLHFWVRKSPGVDSMVYADHLFKCPSSFVGQTLPDEDSVLNKFMLSVH